MSKCNIIDQSVLTLNGGEGLYGGTATSFSYTFGTLNSNNRATISISGPNLGRPEVGDSVSVGFFGGASFNMDVASYSKSRSKDSSSLTINLVDTSHRILDQRFITMDYGPALFGGALVYSIGAKRVPKMNNMVGQGVPTPYTSFVKSNKLSDPGVSVGYATNDPLGGTTLEDNFGGIYNGPYPSGPLKYEGSWREVMCRLANDAGALPYWDNDTEKVEVITLGSFGGGGGGANVLIEKIAETCGGNYSISESEDFTVTQSSYVIGEMKQEADKQASSEQMGGTTTRWLRANLIDPDFHIGICGRGKADKLLDFNEEHAQKALAASSDPKVFGLYAIQSVVDHAGKPEFGAECELKGRGGQAFFDASRNGNFKAKDLKYTENTLIRDYYMRGLKEPIMCGFTLKKNGPLSSAVMNAIGKDKKAGYFNKQGGEFEDYDMIIHDPAVDDGGAFPSVMGSNGQISAGDDTLRQYLQLISKFKNSVYVVRGQRGQGVSGNLPSWNGFFLTAETSLPTMALKGTDGFNPVSFNPFVSVAACSNSFITGLAKALVYMYKPKKCDVLDKTMVGEFINQMYRNNISAFMAGGGGTGAYDSEKAAEEAGQGFYMHLLIRNEPVSEKPAFNPLLEGCGKSNATLTGAEEVAQAADSIEKIEGLNSSIDNKCFESLQKKGINLLKVKKIKVHENIDGFQLVEPSRTKRMWYNVKCAPSVFNNPALKFSAEGSEASDSGGSVWKKSLTKVSVSPSDIVTPDMQAAFDDYEEKTGNPGFTIEKRIWSAMGTELKRRMEEQAWVDEETGKSNTITFEGTGGLSTIPSASSGVESISISVSGGKTKTTITTGNSILKQLISILRGSTVASGHILFTAPDLVNSVPNNHFGKLSRGAIGSGM